MTQVEVTVRNKPPFVNGNLAKAIKKAKKEGKKRVKTTSRATTIIPQMVGLVILVHNGKMFIPVSITTEMIGKKLGEFAPTRTFKGHAGAKKGKGDK